MGSTQHQLLIWPSTASLAVTLGHRPAIAADSEAMDQALQAVGQLPNEQHDSKQEEQLLGDHSSMADVYHDGIQKAEDVEGRKNRQAGQLADRSVLNEAQSAVAGQASDEDSMLPGSEDAAR